MGRLSVCVAFAVFTDCESCTRPISTNPGSMEAVEYGLTRGTCFLACRFELDAVAGLLWISWCVLGRADFSVFFPFSIFVFFEHTRPAASMRPPCLIYLSTSNEARRWSEATDSVFCLLAKKPLHTGVRTGRHYLISLSVCLCVRLSVCLSVYIRRFYLLRELYEADFHKLGIYGSERVWASAWDVFRRAPSRVGRGRRAAVAFVVCFGWSSFFRFFFFRFFFSSKANGLPKV